MTGQSQNEGFSQFVGKLGFVLYKKYIGIRRKKNSGFSSYTKTFVGVRRKWGSRFCSYTSGCAG